MWHLETILLVVLLMSFASLLIAWIIFRLSSMRRIEAKVRAEGRDLIQRRIAIDAV